MSHEMFENDHALYVGEPAWHGLGTVVENAPTTMDAMRMAKMDFSLIIRCVPSLIAQLNVLLHTTLIEVGSADKLSVPL